MSDKVEDSMWSRCLFQEIRSAKLQGKQTVEFSDVDLLVLNISRMPFDRMIRYMNEDNVCGKCGAELPAAELIFDGQTHICQDCNREAK